MHHLDLEHTYTRVYYIARNNVWYFLSYLRPPLSHDASRQSSRSKSFLFFMISFFFFSFIHSLLSPIELMKIILCPSLHNLLVHRHFLVVQCNYILFFFFPRWGIKRDSLDCFTQIIFNTSSLWMNFTERILLPRELFKNLHIPANNILLNMKIVLNSCDFNIIIFYSHKYKLSFFIIIPRFPK